MRVYLDLVWLINFFVDYLLLLGTKRITGGSARWQRLLLAAAIGGVYGAMSLVPDLAFLQNFLWKVVFLFAISLTAFGFSRATVRKAMLFCFLSLALGGAGGMLGGRFGSMILGMTLIFVLIRYGFAAGVGSQKIVACVITHRGREYCTNAMLDTGNTLRDPISGEQVFVAGADLAERLTGLTSEMIGNPVDAMGKLEKARLIPYKTVGSEGGMLPAIRPEEVRIGAWRGSPLIALSPVKLSGDYQILTGGVLQ